MIVPYLSIDLFFVTAPFLCRSQRELSAFAKRIAAAIVVAGTCFLLFPRRFAFDRPQADGWLGAVFDWFRGMDLPYNLFPSLHIALGSLLVVTYARHTRGVIRVLVCGWFVLIAASAVLTWQHHILDVVGGLALAGYCFYFIREDAGGVAGGSRPADRSALSRGCSRAQRCRGRLLALGRFAPLAGSFTGARRGGVFSTSARRFFAKTDGVVPWSTCWALGPCLLGQHLSRLYYRRQCRAWDQVTPNVWIGRVLNEREAAQAVHAGVTAVLDLTAEFSAPKAFRRSVLLECPSSRSHRADGRTTRHSWRASFRNNPKTASSTCIARLVIRAAPRR